MAILVCFLVRCWAQRYEFEQYGTDHGITSQSINCLWRDRSGLLWVGTTNGLFRFDGHHAIRFAEAEGLPHSNVISLHESADGTIWAGTWGGLAWRPGTGGFTAAADKTFRVPIPVQGIASDASGAVFVATRKGLARVDRFDPAGKLEFRILPRVAGTTDPYVTSVTTAPGGVLWFGCGFAVCRMDARGSTLWGPEHGVPMANRASRYQAVQVDSAGTVWVRNAEFLLRLGRGETVFQKVPQEAVGPILSAYPSLALIRGRIAVPTVRGLAMDTDAGWRTLNGRNGLPADELSYAVSGDEASVWIGTMGGGLLRWAGAGRWEAYTHEQGLVSSRIIKLRQGSAGRIWAATTESLHTGNRTPEGWKWTPYPIPGVMLINDFVIDGRDRIWVLTPDRRLVRFDPATGQTVLVPGLSGAPHSLTQDSKGNLWVATGDGVFSVWMGSPQPSLLRHFPLGPQTPNFGVNAVLETKNGELWLGTYKGVMYYGGGSWHLIRMGLIWGLTEGPAGEVYAIPFEAGPVRRIQRQTDERLGVDTFAVGAGDTPLQVQGIAFDSSGRPWVLSDKGPRVYSEGTWHSIRRADGLIWEDSGSGTFLETAKGEYWLGSARGLLHLLPGADPLPVPVEPFVSSLVIDGVRKEFQGPAVPVIREQSVLVELSAKPFRPGLTYRFRVGDADAGDWRMAENGEFLLPALRSGEHAIQVAVRSGDGPWSAEYTAMQVDVNRPWPAVVWWLLVAFPVLFVSGRIYVRRRLRRAEQQKLALESMIAERTRDLAEAKDRAEEGSRAKTQFVANLSHEIRTPMNGILGMQEWLLESRLSAEQRESLTLAHQSARKLLGLLDDMLDIAKIEAGKLRLRPVVFAPRECVKEAIQVVDPHRLGLTLKADVAAAVPESLFGDETRLRQILINLLSNAVKFTPSGLVAITVAPAASGEGWCELAFTVSDTGIGIPQDRQAAIFEAFEQVDNSLSRERSGTGLGLAITTHLVNRMGGTITVDSKPGEGSVFRFHARFELPQEWPEAANSPAGAAEAPIAVQVLLVEDNLTNQRVAERMLAKRGYQVTVAASGPRALALAAEKAFDVILMDVQMPGMDGLETTRRLRATEQTAQTPILAVTAHAMREDEASCLEAGMNGYVSKPIDWPKLYAMIEARVAAARPAPLS